MRKIIVSEFMTLDGVIENPMWSMKYWNDQIADFKASEMAAVDSLLLGRVTYEGFAAAWPQRQGQDAYADKMNSMPKYVVTTTLAEGSWTNSRLIRENVVEEIHRLKGQPGDDILIFGSGALINSLVPHGLIDEYRLLVYPLVLGSGQRLFSDGTNTRLRLVDATPFDSGAVAMIYRPQEAAES